MMKKLAQELGKFNLGTVFFDEDNNVVCVLCARFMYTLRRNGRFVSVTVGGTGLTHTHMCAAAPAIVAAIRYYESDACECRNGVLWSYDEEDEHFDCDGYHATQWAYYDVDRERWLYEYEDYSTGETVYF